MAIIPVLIVFIISLCTAYTSAISYRRMEENWQSGTNKQFDWEFLMPAHIAMYADMMQTALGCSRMIWCISLDSL